MLDENQLLEAIQKIATLCQSWKSLENEMSTKRKMFVSEDFLSQVYNICIAGNIFQNNDFLLQLLPTAWEF